MGSPPPLSREEFQAIYEAGPEAVWALIERLRAQQAEAIHLLEGRVKELEDRLSKDSRISSKPPSSDPPTSKGKKSRSLREKSGRKPGGQPGHEGKTLALVETPDEILVHSLTACPHCQTSLEGVGVEAIERRQVVELPPIRAIVTEHRAEVKQCPCCKAYGRAVFPTEVTAPIQYGPRLQAVGVYLTGYELLPYARSSELMADLFGVSLSEGTLYRFMQGASEELGPTEAALKAALAKAEVAHFDETGGRVEGKLRWFHVASTKTLTHYACHAKRGKAAMEAIGILPAFQGIACHDAWASYFTFEGSHGCLPDGPHGCHHSLCNGHHLRELQFLVERYSQPWAKEMAALLREAHRAVEAAKAQGQTALDPTVREAFERRYREQIRQGYAANPPPPRVPGRRGKVKQSPARNLLDRLSRYETETLRFLHDFRVPFDNNQAERDVRMLKVQQKVSGGFRSEAGANAFCRVRSYLSTARKQGHNVLVALVGVFCRQPLLLAPLPS
jgi:transposase